MTDASSRIEGAASVHDATRLANQRLLEMLAERMDGSPERSGAGNALDQLRKNINDNLQAAASKAAGSAQTDPGAAATDPTTLPTAAKAGGKGSNDGILVQLDPVLQQAALLLQQAGDATRQQAAPALLDRLASGGAQMLTAGDDGTYAGSGFMPGSHPWLQLPESFSARSTLPDVMAKGDADGSLNQSGGDGSSSTRQRTETTRALADGVATGAVHTGPIGAAAARSIALEFHLTLPQAAGVVAGALHVGADRAAARRYDAGRRRAPQSSARRQRFLDFALLQQLDPETPQAACTFAAHELRNELAGLLPLLRRARTAEEAVQMLLRHLDGDEAPADVEQARTAQAILGQLGTPGS
ncbi:hypothetical protein M8A51_18275 [Schlegelella sp. S2-27]|uniref:DUF222 domain-containing protein n=1 Tax=Caldimonas mangrovi TaxID=2944811 RepID=A0ABT0YS71_9BURK|nr:hypothetical protein [Caldimonas mangrovi]MCM5681478.1 hypothetical protein [Caldimonas mangrovi]